MLTKNHHDKPYSFLQHILWLGLTSWFINPCQCLLVLALWQYWCEEGSEPISIFTPTLTITMHLFLLWTYITRIYLAMGFGFVKVGKVKGLKVWTSVFAIQTAKWFKSCIWVLEHSNLVKSNGPEQKHLITKFTKW